MVRSSHWWTSSIFIYSWWIWIPCDRKSHSNPTSNSRSNSTFTRLYQIKSIYWIATRFWTASTTTTTILSTTTTATTILQETKHLDSFIWIYFIKQLNNSIPPISYATIEYLCVKKRWKNRLQLYPIWTLRNKLLLKKKQQQQ